jgi:hypothetical protein
MVSLSPNALPFLFHHAAIGHRCPLNDPRMGLSLILSVMRVLLWPLAHSLHDLPVAFAFSSARGDAAQTVEQVSNDFAVDWSTVKSCSDW